ncbi:MAG: cysteine--tRNA ligase [Candidatus Omnitrophica bacterium]|nr:cysteine--tRNA ligase [Candidatus Omnitrophota bacterium]
MKIYNTLSREKIDFKPLRKNKVSMYVCGPTVYDDPHIGHARSAYIFDVIRRYFEYKKYKVTFVRNVTDVDDKIINKAKEEFKEEDLNSTVKKVSDKYLESYHRYMNELGIKVPDREPKATEYIEKMKSFISLLIKRGVAYESEGDVYFNVRKAKDYGKLSNQGLEMLESGARIAPGENKKDPLDFALWKKAKEGEPSWPSPWGAGRPGWHIECSVMSSDILGDEFDIHGGGMDLIFPHHENEIAQSEGAGKKFARYWIHNGLLTINKEKMAKSLGNFVTIDEVLNKYSPDVLKTLFLQTHYSKPVDFSWERMEEARKAYERLCRMREEAHNIIEKLDDKKRKEIERKAKTGKEFEYICSRFEEAMDDDFNMPKAWAVVQNDITAMNSTIQQYRQLTYKSTSLQELYYTCYELLPKIAEVFGLTFEQKEKQLAIPKEEVAKLIDLRDKARAKKDFKTADRIREELNKAGIILEDQKGETTWRLK